MKNVLAIAGRELRAYFVSPVAYVVLTGFLLLAGWFFFNLFSRFSYLLQIYSAIQNPEMLERLNLNETVIAPLLHNLSIVLVILVPVITMRSFAEERRSGTFELLLTSPIRVGQIVLGKFLGAATFLFLMLALTGIYPSILLAYGNPEVGVLLSGYLGLFLLGLTFVAIGLLTSSFTDNQIIAAVSCLVALLLLYVIGWPADTMGGSATGEMRGALEMTKVVLEYLSVVEHFGELVRGVIDTRDLVYFASMTGGALFLTHRSVESLRWR